MIGSTYWMCRHQLPLPPQIAASACPDCSSIAAAIEGAGREVPRRRIGRRPAPSDQQLIGVRQRAEHVRSSLGSSTRTAFSRSMRRPISRTRSLDHVAAAEQDRLRDPLVEQGLHRAQHPLVLALAVDDALGVASSPPRTPDA